MQILLDAMLHRSMSEAGKATKNCSVNFPGLPLGWGALRVFNVSGLPLCFNVPSMSNLGAAKWPEIENFRGFEGGPREGGGGGRWRETGTMWQIGVLTRKPRTFWPF